MKILVLSDSHSSLAFMRKAISAVKPDAVVHLGDHYDDGETMAEEFPWIPFHLVAGNCDRYRVPEGSPELLCYDICGVRLFMTHGHRQYVKTTRDLLIAQAMERNAKAVLYGHTHEAECRMEDTLWILNPGSCGHGRRTAGVIEVSDGRIINCSILDELAMEV